MNEQELKEIWKSADSQDIPKIDFEKVQKKMIGWHGKLRRKIELDSLFGILILVIYLALLIPLPHLIYPLPLILIMYPWYYWKLWTIYRSETQAQDVINTRKYFEDKAAKLTGFIRECRIVTLLFFPPVALISCYVSLSNNPFTSKFMEYEYLSAHPVLIYASLIFCGVLTVIAMIGVEILIRISYLPSLDRVKELLEQLKFEE